MRSTQVVLPKSLTHLAQRTEALIAHTESLAQEYDSTNLCIRTWIKDQRSNLERLVAASDFMFEQLLRQPHLLPKLIAANLLHQPLSTGSLRQSLATTLEGCNDETQLAQALRQFRQMHQVRIIWRDLTYQADLTETCRDLSDLADNCIDLTYQWLYTRFCAQYGIPRNIQGQAQHLVVLGMGKLGAYELNLSSDIDLIFAYPETGATDGAKELDNQTFFVRLGQKLIKALDAITVDGFVFRVDMRLRPYGSSGALVFSFAALEQYYQEQGRDWERYAMIKARVVAGDQQAGQQLMELLRPFVYRRYLDFSAIESLRAMKQLIAQEVKRKGMAENIKLGAGGIREVEFIAQMFQLIHGGRDSSLQQRPLLGVLATLETRGYLPSETVTELREGYYFLRYLEHALQAIADQQTQVLPDNPTDQARVALMLGFTDWPSLMQQLNHWRDRINAHFQQVIACPKEDTETQALTEPAPRPASQCLTWGEEWLEKDTQQQLHLLGFSQPEAAAQRLKALHQGSQRRSMQNLGRERLDAFIPRLVCRIALQPDPDLVLSRVLPLVEAIARRSAYLVLLTENPGALERLLSLCGASAWIAEQVTRFPLLLDELLNAERLYAPPAAPELAAELNERLMRIPEEDLEQQMEALRHFKLAHSLRVAASEVAGTLPLMKVSDYLTWLAEAILEQVLALAWKHTTARHGQPKRRDGTLCNPDFIIVGYGKLGGIELGHGSDLDLVFIHNGDPNQETDGLKPIDGAQFFIRLGQRIIHLLTTQTASGPLYEVDMRLRPSGAAGLLVSTLSHYAQYQSQEAWTWEHQALVRARPVAGCRELSTAFQLIRNQVLGRARDLSQLAHEVSEMRAKMRTALGTSATHGGTTPEAFQPDHRFHLKHDAGGIVDIEFMVQYATLAWSHQYPELLRYTDNIRILDGLEHTKLLPVASVQALQNAYKAYRAAAHRLSLQRQPGVVAGDQFHHERQSVLRIWHSLGLS